MKKEKQTLVADFETTINTKRSQVWSAAYIDLAKVCKPDNVFIDLNINSFMEHMLNYTDDDLDVYFHNLKFDGTFILSWLKENDMWHELSYDGELLSLAGRKAKDYFRYAYDYAYTYCVSDLGQWYSITIIYDGKYIMFKDSLKLLPFTVRQIGKSFKTKYQKLEMEYDGHDAPNQKLLPHEVDYIKNDVTIVAMALKKFFDEGLTKMTQASNAMYDYKKIITPKYFKEFYPELSIELDGEIRSSYRGGFTYLNPIYANKVVGEGIVLDVNSLYPSVMYEKPMPFGKPIFFSGRYTPDETYDLYIQRLACSFKVKKNMIPTIQLKGNLSFMPNEYVEDTKGQIVTLTLTSVDLKLFLEHYEPTSPIEWGGGWKFRSITGLFTEYIDKWSGNKIKAKEEGNHGLYLISKLFQKLIDKYVAVRYNVYIAVRYIALMFYGGRYNGSAHKKSLCSYDRNSFFNIIMFAKT